MRLRGFFLHSATARRVFRVLLAAALVPLVLFGTLGYRLLADHVTEQSQASDRAWLKQVGLRTFDRLVAARAALAAHAGTAPWIAPAVDDPQAREVLGNVATMRDDGAAVAGDASLARDWLAAPGADLRGAPPRSLAWVVRPGRPARVVVAHRDRAARGWWLAEIDPTYLWADFSADGLGAEVCVSDRAGRSVRCEGTGAREGTSWTLFLAAAFGAEDWQLVGTPVAQGAWAALPLGRWMLIGSLGTLLLVAMLGLVLVRRLMVPLDQLSAGTRRLAAHDWSARVPVSGTDELAQLAGSFNTMAERVGRQVQVMQVHSEIDRSILEGRALAEVLSRLTQRLQSLAVGVRVAVIARADDGERWLAFRSAGEPAGVDVPPPVWAMARSGRLEFRDYCSQETCGWALRSVGHTATDGVRIAVTPALWHDEPIALLVFVAEGDVILDDERNAELAELRDRVVLTLAWAQRERSLVERAVRDGLTGLLNRNGLHDACEAFLAAGEPFSTLQIDLDGFKDVNDSFGHGVGDDLLQQVAARLEDAVPAPARLARPGGDEFVILLPGPLHRAQALAATLCARLRVPFEHAVRELHIGASVGVAAFPEHGRTRGDLLRRADLAMYAAKQAGRGRWHTYEPALDEQVSERAWLVAELRLALDREDLRLHYQPRVGSHGHALHSVEALLRWTHPTHGPIGPQRFVPLAEQAGLVDRIGNWVLDEALRQLAQWRADGLQVPRVAVNVSPQQLDDEGFAERVLQTVRRHGLTPSDLEIEITESLFVGDIGAVAARLAPLRERGVQVALDDFGTGYSSLSVLHRLPVDVLKIDRSFVTELGGRESADAVARTIVALARALGKTVVAEGVETALQEAHLVALGCDELQGYLFSPPLAPPAFQRYARRGAVVAEAG